MLQIAIVVRIIVGAQDPPEVVALRQAGRRFVIGGITHSPRNPRYWLQITPLALRGVSAKDVTAIGLEAGATDETVAVVAESFPNLTSLSVTQGKVTADGLRALKRCEKLWLLDVSESDIGDELAEVLPLLPKLRMLDVRCTNVGDEFSRAIAPFKRLERCWTRGTLISPEAAAALRTARPDLETDRDSGQIAVYATIRWSDGKASHSYRGFFDVGYQGPRLKYGPFPWSGGVKTSSSGLNWHYLCWRFSDFAERPDGDYRFVLTLGTTNAIPVDFTVKNGVPSVSQIEFQMPMPRPTPPLVAR